MTRDSGRGALDGVTVVEIATMAAAPWAATFLAEYGATVIKVEDPKGGDGVRHWGKKNAGYSLLFKSLGRNKQFVTLNLRDEEGRGVLRRMLAEADVLVANFRPSTMESWGLTPDGLAEVNQRLVTLHTTGFGNTGPYRDRPGFGTLVEAMSGFSHLTGEHDGPPTLPAVPIGDYLAGITGAYAVMVALHERDHISGRGQYIDLSLLESLMRTLEHTAMEYEQLGTVPMRHGNRWDVTVPRNAYRTSDDRWIAMSGSAPTVALRIFDAIERPEWKTDARYNTPAARLEHVEEIDAAIAEWISQRPMAEAMSRFEELGVAAAPIYDAEQLWHDQHIRARGAYVPVDDPDMGSIHIQRPVARLSRSPGAVRHLGAAVGQDNVQVYGKLLGLSAADLAEMAGRGVV